MEENIFDKKLADFEKKLQSFHMPRYRELPDIDLYMDQVISYINKYLNIFNETEENVITPSMINNYVKHGILPPPNGKKYSRVHLAYICAVFFLKQVLKMDEIKNIIAHQVKCSNEFKAYTYFCQELEEAFRRCCLLTKSPEEITSPIDDQTKFALKSCTLSIANLIYAQKVIALQAEADGETTGSEGKEREVKEREKKEKKEKSKSNKKDQ